MDQSGGGPFAAAAGSEARIERKVEGRCDRRIAGAGVAGRVGRWTGGKQRLTATRLPEAADVLRPRLRLDLRAARSNQLMRPRGPRDRALVEQAPVRPRTGAARRSGRCGAPRSRLDADAARPSRPVPAVSSRTGRLGTTRRTAGVAARSDARWTAVVLRLCSSEERRVAVGASGGWALSSSRTPRSSSTPASRPPLFLGVCSHPDQCRQVLRCLRRRSRAPSGRCYM